MDCSTACPQLPSIMPMLYRQFLEQSSMCDVIIKVGSWEKRFHWCVLVTSPFFEAIYRSNFMEKQTGIVELHEWPACLVQLSLLSLYGREPEVTEWNIDDFLDIAEFLLIPELKRVCVDFFRRTTVTVDNYLQMLELSSVYGFELTNCERFIMGHLPEILEQEVMLNATTETVKMLMSDPTLSYVPVQSWFNFLIRWVQNTPEKLSHFVDLFRMLDFCESDVNFINNIVAREPIVTKNKEEFEKLLTACRENDDVIIFQFYCTFYTNAMIYLNLRTKVLQRVSLSIDNEDMLHFENKFISGVKDSRSPYIYKVCQSYGSFRVFTHNLSNAESSVSEVVINDADDTVTLSDNLSYGYSLGNHMVAVVFYDSKRRVANAGSILSRIPYCLWRDALVSTLYIGTIGESITDLHAVLTLRNHSIKRVCCGENGAIAMLTSDRDCIYIFDESTGELECVQLGSSFRNGDWQHTVHLEGLKDGFVLHDEDSVVSVLRANETALGPQYLMKQIMWETCEDPSYKFDHYFTGGRWFRTRYSYAVSGSGVNLEYVNHEDLTTTNDTANLPWTAIPIPHLNRIPMSIRTVSLPRGTLSKCHMDCPHCQRIREAQLQQKM